MGKLRRRDFLKLAAGEAALSLTFAGKAADKLIPYVIPPDHVKPGVVTFFATVCRECPAGCGMHLWHRDGRVTKAEGNPDHPVNRGALCARGQSALQGLYDPDRLRRVLRIEPAYKVTPWQWERAIPRIGAAIRQSAGRVVLVSDLQTGALAELMGAFADAFGRERLLLYEPFGYGPQRSAHDALFEMPAIPDYRIDECDFLISFAADFLETWVSPVQHARRFAAMHSYREGKLGRVVYVGPRLSMTAANADEFVQVAPGCERRVAMAMLKAIVERGWAKRELGRIGESVAAMAPDDLSVPGLSAERIEELAKAFVQAEASAALPGPDAGAGPAARDTALAAALLNYAAGRVGQTVDFSRSHALGDAAAAEDVRGFLSGLTSDDVLIIHNANPAYASEELAEGIGRAGLRVYLGTMRNETAELCEWVLPVDSPLESWGDYEPQVGCHGLMQPTMARLYDTRAAGDVLLSIARAAGHPLSPPGSEAPAADFRGWLQRRWERLGRRLDPQKEPQEFWVDALRRGGVWEPVADGAQPARLRAASFSAPAPEKVSSGQAALWLWPSILLYNGHLANRGWLQEVPEPVSYVTWTSLIDIHQELARSTDIRDGDVIELENERGKARAPARLTDDVAPGTVALAFGQGHSRLGRNADGRGANAFRLLGAGAAGEGFGLVTVRNTGERAQPAYAAATQQQHGRRVLQWMELSKLRPMEPGQGDHLILPLPEGYDPHRDYYPPHEYSKHRWAMVADLQRCIGCGSCAVACCAENNNAVMGEEQVLKGREMAWLKVIPYRGPDEPQRLGFLPLMCQQCDAAPCEPVCPVFASVHNDEGLNDQVYNRCIGTRYCSNNCPYKVRRFNWLNVEWPESLRMQLNPEVTVRCRGVMEKCTFCVQRIRRAEYQALREGRPVRDGEIQPACVQTCPTRALVFGDLLDEQAEVTRLTRQDPRRYHLLEALNTKPAVTYLRRIRRDV